MRGTMDQIQEPVENVTERLLVLDPTLELHNEGEWSGTTLQYSAFSDACVEAEVGEFLYAMVRILKPQHVCETGSHAGIGAAYLGLALKKNGFGILDTIEYLPHLHYAAQNRVKQLQLESIVTCHFGDATKFHPDCNYQLILLDTEPMTRFYELICFYPFLDKGGYVFIHDTPRTLCQGNVNPDHPNFKSWPFGDIPSEITNWVRENKLRPFHFPTPRGLTGFYKTHSDDYDWREQCQL